MPVFRTLLLLFITVPLLEFYLLVEVSARIGILPTIFCCIFTAVLGAALLRRQGLQAISRIQTQLAAGEFPARELLDGAVLLCCGALLLTPGFFTDAVGFLCLVPRVRRWLVHALFLLNRQAAPRSPADHVTLDGEYWEEDNKRLSK